MIWDKESQAHASKLVVAAIAAHNLAIPFDDVDEYMFYIDDGQGSEQIAREAQQQREDTNQLYLEEQEFQRQHLSRYWQDQQRRQKAKLHREALHQALFQAKGLRFVDTTLESRLQEKTKHRMMAR
ncbi:uncharacterized protein SRS1_02164 [Sporisorium reilianum f. sp. reilianum]|uniref:Uncharacterized protein n=1 Tax=Sporisorium reilianum f. sp. reilianum TaxID=72559 RepID=A0A2N8UDW6_9BASI|nr:uncharacterized protein SRS1_02164 [Sporisorium reilianum f. sp. reilianum]